MTKTPLFILLTIFLTPYIPGGGTLVTGINNVTIPPLSPNKDTIISVSGTARNLYTLKVDFMREIDAGHNVILEETSEGNRFSYTFVYPKRFVTAGITKFRFILSCFALSSGVQTMEFEVGKIVPMNIALQNEYKDVYSTTSNIVSYSIFKGQKIIPEKFIFNNFQKEQSLSYFNSLDISKISFQYSCSDFKCSFNESYVYIQNINGWFSNIGIPFGSFRKLPLVVSENNNIYTFSFQDIFYINPLTNEMFNEYKEGTVQTQKLFFPKNGFKDFKVMQMNLNLKGVGINESMVSQSFIYEVNRNYFGNCYDSEYCIKAEEGTPNYEFGEVEEK